VIVKLRQRLLTSSIYEEMKRYRLRHDDVIYAHMLDQHISALGRAKDYTLPMAVGEIIHLGLDRIFTPADEKCVDLYYPDGLGRMHQNAYRFIRRTPSGFYVRLCGSADAMVEYDGTVIPVELKTTRGSKVRDEWVRRTETYAFLYGTGRALLIVYNVVTGAENDFLVELESKDTIVERVLLWLKGLYPRPNLEAGGWLKT